MSKKKPKILELNEIISILESGDLDKFIGTRESECFEAKSSIERYNFDLGISNRANFAKDITSLANKNGGYIIIGLKTPDKKKGDELVPYDIVVKLNLFLKKDFYIKIKDRIAGMLKESVYPKPSIVVKWYPYNKKKSLGLGTIFISKQDEKIKYFFAKIIEPKIKGEYYGVPVRADNETNWMKIDEIYLRTKKLPSQWQESYKNLSDKIDNLFNEFKQLRTELSIKWAQKKGNKKFPINKLIDSYLIDIDSYDK